MLTDEELAEKADRMYANGKLTIEQVIQLKSLMVKVRDFKE